MRTRISPDNPHGCNRHGFAWEHIPPAAAAHLDFGCHDGEFLASLSGKGIGRLVGVDAFGEAIRRANDAHPDIEAIHIAGGTALPFEDGAFASVSVLDVIEHVCDQVALLAEIRRVLADDGRLIVTVPRQYLLSALDVGNFKFRFPALHRWFYCRRHGRAEYQRRYLANPDGLIGDVSAAKRWHEHFTPAGLGSLLAQAGFAAETFDGSAFFTRALRVLGLLPVRSAALARLGRRLYDWDAKRFEWMNLFCVARKAL